MAINQKEYSPAEEIKELERLLEEKRRQLTERGEEREPKEAFREAFKERYIGKTPEEPLESSSATPPPFLPHPPTGDLKAKTREEQLAFLIQISFERGIDAAIRIAKTQTPWILDELHDRLVDEYYEKLVQARKIEE